MMTAASTMAFGRGMLYFVPMKGSRTTRVQHDYSARVAARSRYSWKVQWLIRPKLSFCSSLVAILYLVV